MYCRTNIVLEEFGYLCPQVHETKATCFAWIIIPDIENERKRDMMVMLRVVLVVMFYLLTVILAEH